MKPIAAVTFAALALAGAACSESPARAEAPAAEVQTVAAGEDVTGTLNLSVPGSAAQSSDTGGTLNLNIGGGSDQGGLMVGAEGFGGGDFGEAPSLDIDLEDASDDATLAPPADVTADDLVRLPAPK